MSEPAEAMDTNAVIIKEVVPEVVMEAEEVAPKVAEVLAEVPKSPRHLDESRPQPRRA